jgi:hypothetical protein
VASACLDQQGDPPPDFQGDAEEQIRAVNSCLASTPSFRGDAKQRTLEIPGLVLRTIPE